MRVAIIADPIDEQNAGIHFYTKSLTEELLNLDGDNEYILIHCRKNEWFDRQVEKRKRFTKHVIVPIFRKVFGWCTFRKFFLLSLVFLKYKPDVILEPAHIGPFSLFWKCKKVVTIHDLTPILFPEHHIWISRFIHKYFLGIILNNVDGILVPSECTRRDLVRLYSVKKPVAVTYEAASSFFEQAGKEEISRVKKKYGIEGKYILSVGTLEPRKNLSLVLEVFGRIHDVKWVIVGGKGWHFDAMEACLRGDNGTNIVVTDYVSEGDLQAFYSGAEVLVYPSLYEGFGLPILEAMACGCPVIASNVSSLPEVVGGAGELFDPKDSDDLERALQKVLGSEKIRAEMREKGFARAREFSWEKCAKETINFLKDLVDEEKLS